MALSSAHDGDMFSDASGLEVLTEGESLELLASTSLGRIVYSDRAMPFVAPVNFVLDGMDIVIRTSHRSGLAINVPGNIVAFEVDHLDDIQRDETQPDSIQRTGWSVVVTGQGELVRDVAEIARLDKLPLRSWAPTMTNCYLRLRAHVVSGRRLVAREPV